MYCFTFPFVLFASWTDKTQGCRISNSSVCNIKIIIFFNLMRDECRAPSSICVGHCVWRHNAALKCLDIFEVIMTNLMQRQSPLFLPYNFFLWRVLIFFWCLKQNKTIQQYFNSQKFLNTMSKLQILLH